MAIWVQPDSTNNSLKIPKTISGPENGSNLPRIF